MHANRSIVASLLAGGHLSRGRPRPHSVGWHPLGAAAALSSRAQLLLGMPVPGCLSVGAGRIYGAPIPATLSSRTLLFLGHPLSVGAGPLYGAPLRGAPIPATLSSRTPLFSWVRGIQLMRGGGGGGAISASSSPQGGAREPLLPSLPPPPSPAPFCRATHVLTPAPLLPPPSSPT